MVHLPVAPYIWPVFGKEMSIKRNWEYALHFEHTLSILIEDLEIFKPALEVIFSIALLKSDSC